MHLDDRGIDLDLATGDLQRLGLGVEHAERLIGVGVVDAAEPDGRQLAFLGVGVDAASDVHERKHRHEHRVLGEGFDESGPLDLTGGLLGGFDESESHGGLLKVREEPPGPALAKPSERLKRQLK